MKFIQFSVSRRVTISMLYALVFLLGFLAWQRLPREFMPSLEFPQLVVLTVYENASSREVETLITKVIEEACGTVKGVRRIHSLSKEGISLVTVEFQWGVDMDFASLNLREKIDLTKVKLPREAGEPRIEKYNPFALPVMVLSLSGKRTAQELLKIAKRPVAELMEKVPGVAAVSLTGGLEREIIIELDQAKLANYQVSILQAGEAVSRGNVTYPAGTVKDETYEYVVRVMGAYAAPEEINQVVVKVDRDKLFPSDMFSRGRAGQRRSPEKSYREKQTAAPLVLLSSLGIVRDTFKERASYARYDGQENISLAILKQGDAHVTEVAAAARKKLDNIKSKLPHGLELKIIYDQSLFIKAGIRQMVNAGLMGACLAFLVLFLFFRDCRNALIVSAAIPSSILAALFLMHLKGITLNTVSLAGLAVGIGLLVDGAIVVVENITRHKEAGKASSLAALTGAREMLGPVTSSVGTTIVVFLPLIFVLGIIGQVFRDLSWAVVFSQMASLVVAFTLVPMLAGMIFRPGALHPPRFLDFLYQAAGRLRDRYEHILKWCLDHAGRTLIFAAIIWIGSLGLTGLLPRSLFPSLDQDQFILHLKMPLSTRLEITNNTAKKLEALLTKIPEVKHCMVTVGSLPQQGLQPLGGHEAQLVIDLAGSRQRSAAEIIQEIKGGIEGLALAGGRVVFQQPGGTFSELAGKGAPIIVEIKGYELKNLRRVSRQLQDRLKGISEIYNVNTSLDLTTPEIEIKVNRDQAAVYSLSVADMAKTLLTAVRGRVVSKYREEGREIDIRVRLAEQDRMDLKALRRLLIRSPLEIDVPLEAVAAIKHGTGPSEILHYDQQRTVLVTAGLYGKPLDKLRPEIEDILEELREQNPDLGLTLTGEAARIEESFASLKIILIISLLLVYMIMAAQFESFGQPFLIILTIPLALIGMGPALLLAGHSLSAMAGMGLVLLCGIIVNNGIVLLDYINQRRQKDSSSLKTVLQEACRVRLRPIVMTAATTILGLLPLALGLSRETQMQAPLAIVVVSGLFVSTCLTLVILPSMYLLFENLKEKILTKRLS